MAGIRRTFCLAFSREFSGNDNKTRVATLRNSIRSAEIQVTKGDHAKTQRRKGNTASENEIAKVIVEACVQFDK